MLQRSLARVDNARWRLSSRFPKDFQDHNGVGIDASPPEPSVGQAMSNMTYTQGGATRSLRLEREHGTDRRHMLTYADEVSQALDTLVMIASRMATPATPSPRAASRQDCVASCFKELQSLFHERLVVLEDAPMPGILIEDELGVRKAARQVDRVAAGHHPVVITIRH